MRAVTVCGWVDWCARDGEFEVELSNRAGTERMVVCRLHLRAAGLYGYRNLGPDGPADLPVTTRPGASAPQGRRVPTTTALPGLPVP